MKGEAILWGPKSTTPRIFVIQALTNPLLALCVATAALIGCGAGESSEVLTESAEPDLGLCDEKATLGATIWHGDLDRPWVLEDVGLAMGIQDRNGIQKGGAAADFNGDGYPDLYLGNVFSPPKLLLNRGDHFEEQPDAPGTGDDWGVATADYDNDGDTDLWVACGGFIETCADGLFRNDGVDPETGFVIFADVSYSSGMAGDDRASMSGNWADYNNDGWLDLFVSVKVSQPWLFGGEDNPNATTEDFLWHNNGDGTFTNRAGELGLEETSDSSASSWLDYDNDGWLDLFVPRLLVGENTLYRNVNGERFEAQRHLDFSDPTLAFGSLAEDFDGDGDFDIVISEYYQEWIGQREASFDGPTYYMNDGEGGFIDMTRQTGLNATVNGTIGNMGLQVGDFNLDGDFEVLFGAGGPWVEGGEMNRFFSATVDPDLGLRWIDRSDVLDWEAPEDCDESTDVVPYPYRTHASMFLDYDQDGDFDLFVGNGGMEMEFNETWPFEPNRLFRNDSPEANRGVWIDLEGVQSNRDGVGAKLVLTSSDGEFVRTRLARRTSGFCAGVPRGVAIGVGDALGPFTVTVTWPSGVVDTLEGLEKGERVELVEGTKP